jgi:hypothetical protein
VIEIANSRGSVLWALAWVGIFFCTSSTIILADDSSPAQTTESFPSPVPNPGSTELTQFPGPGPDVPCCRVRRFGPYITPDPRSAAPTLTEAIGEGLLPPFGWGWYGFGYPGFWGWGYGGWGYGGWGYGGWGYGGWGPYAANYPYPYGFNGSFWYPHGSSWPYPSLSNWTYGGPRYYGPVTAPGYSPYLIQSPYGPAPAINGVQRFGQYYW